MKKFEQDFTIHTHTTISDGYHSPCEMAYYASQQGFNTIGFSDHFIVNPKFENTEIYKALKKSRHAKIYTADFNQTTVYFKEQFNKLEQIAEIAPIKILRGLEVDVFQGDEWAKNFEQSMKILKPDYIIGSAHFIEYDGGIYNMYDIQHAKPDFADKLLTAYWKNIQRIAKSGLCNIIAHLDLPRRRHSGYEEKWADLEHETVDIIAQQKLPLEINTGLYQSDQYYPHPSPRIMEMCAKKQVPMFFSDDAHHAEQLADKFVDAQKYAKMFGANLVGLEKII